MEKGTIHYLLQHDYGEAKKDSSKRIHKFETKAVLYLENLFGSKQKKGNLNHSFYRTSNPETGNTDKQKTKKTYDLFYKVKNQSIKHRISNNHYLKTSISFSWGPHSIKNYKLFSYFKQPGLEG